jgi:hypothetical protein
MGQLRVVTSRDTDLRSLGRNKTMSELRDKLKALRDPYGVDWFDIPFTDFNREIIQPGELDTFPDGAIGIRVDGDFWAVGALPLSFIDTPLKDIVAVVWPQFADEATYGPDVGAFTKEQDHEQ